MDFSYIFKILADYIDFLIDFFLLKIDPVLLDSEHISHEGVAYAIVGISLSYLIRRTRTQINKKISKNPVDDLEIPEAIPVYMLVILFNAVALHVCFWVSSCLWESFTISTIRSTLNSAIILTAAIIPLSQLLAARITSQIHAYFTKSKHPAIGVSTNILIAVFFFVGVVFYYGNVLHIAHDIPLWNIFISMAFYFSILIFLLTIIDAFFLKDDKDEDKTDS